MVQSAGEKAKKGLEAMQSVIHKLESSDWKRSCTETIHTLEQKWIEGKERVEKSVLEAKHKMEESVRRKIERDISSPSSDDTDSESRISEQQDPNTSGPKLENEQCSHGQQSHSMLNWMKFFTRW